MGHCAWIGVALWVADKKATRNNWVRWVRESKGEDIMETQKTGQKNDRASGREYYRFALANLIRMGHCAPTVMQSILDISSTEKEWLVRLSAGMPGGIGNTGFECGGITSPLVMLGTRFGVHN